MTFFGSSREDNVMNIRVPFFLNHNRWNYKYMFMYTCNTNVYVYVYNIYIPILYIYTIYYIYIYVFRAVRILRFASIQEFNDPFPR